MSQWPDDRFFHVAQQVYAADPWWLGEDATAIRGQFAREARDPNRAIWWHSTDHARLAAFFGPDQQVDGQPTAFFGFWESLPDADINRQLFRTAETWARAQGATRMLGPINFSTFHPYRIRLNAFHDGAFPGEPYNPPYYAELLEACGYRQEKRFYSWLGPLAGRAERMAPRIAPLHDALCNEGVTFEPLTPDIWLNELGAFYRYVDQIFGANYAYRGISEDAFRSSYGEPFARRFCPRSSVLARRPDGDVAGFFIALPDYGPLARVNREGCIPLAELNYADHLQRLKPLTMLGKTGGVHPAYRQKGLFAVMSWLMMRWAEPFADHGGAVLVREDNPSARVAGLAFPASDSTRREYALFVKEL
ncbi:hypothetical protein AAIA72_14670 [Hahella sp. SMD15-11]|uniref:N-acetyltransferase n=1 Tax=Thermohahella caldifontis TaxID=3142973 RepID=A0AB39UUN1_9GAMM